MSAAAEDQRTVLLVEDEVLLRMALADDLRERGYIVVEAASGDEARNLVLAGVSFDLVISDIMMPGELNGAGFVRWLYENGVTTKVVLASGLPSALDQARATLLHVNAFVAKPFDHDQFMGQVEALLSLDQV